MKKIVTLLSSLLLAVAVMAAGQRPVVTVSSRKQYKIAIDGRAYFIHNNNIRIASLNRGYHNVQVFEMRRGYFERRETMISSLSFILRKNDVWITVDRLGGIRIRET